MIFRASGTKKRSYIGTITKMNSRGITGSEGAGTLKPKTCVSMVVLCWTEKVWS